MNERAHPFRSTAARDEYLADYDERAERWPIPAQTRLVATSFGETFVRISGSPEAPPLVLVPGDGETSLAWTRMVEALAADHRIYCVDHIHDLGRSVGTRPVTEPGEFVQWLDETLSALELDRVSLVAHSYGGWISTLYALAHPERLSALVLVAPSSTVLPPRLGLLVRAILYFFIPFRFYLQRYMYWYAPDSVRRAETRQVIDEMVDEQLLARRCFKRRKFVPPTVVSDRQWQSLSVPTLFLVGENEVTYSAHAAVRRLSRVAPSVTCAIASEADHHLSLVEPAWTSRQVLAFLGEPPAGH